MRTVYVVNDGGHCYTAAESYGKLVYMSHSTLDKFQIAKMARGFFDFLKTSKPDDYILVSGPTIANICAASVFISLHGRINLLLWRGARDNGEERYLVRTIDLRETVANLKENGDD